jgi:hypothetical protein
VSFMGGMLQQSGLDPVVWRDIAVQLCQVHLLPTQFHTHPPLQSCNPTSSPPPPPPPTHSTSHSQPSHQHLPELCSAIDYRRMEQARLHTEP